MELFADEESKNHNFQKQLVELEDIIKQQEDRSAD